LAPESAKAANPPAQDVEVFPVIDLGLKNNEAIPVAGLLARPTRIARLGNGGYRERQHEKGCDNERILPKRSL